jgi:hypothetical protein
MTTRTVLRYAVKRNVFAAERIPFESNEIVMVLDVNGAPVMGASIGYDNSSMPPT